MRSLFGSLAEGLERKSTDISALTWSKLFGDDARAKSGVSVNIDSALRVSVVLACARVIAEGVAQTPIKAYIETDDGDKTVARNLPLYGLLHDQPNEWMTAYEFIETLTLHAVLAKGGYAFINRIKGEPREIIPLMPHQVKAVQSADYTLGYEVFDLHGKTLETLAPSSILHLRGPSWNGYCGLDIVQEARDAIGLAIATEETHARFHANGAQGGGLISFKNGLKDDQIKRLKEGMKEFTGLANKFRTMILDDSAKFVPMSMSGVDSQHLETRRMQIEEICRFTRVFPLMVMHSDKTATFASAEQFFNAHNIHTLGPWFARWKGIIRRDLITPAQRNAGVVADFVIEALLHADIAAKGQFLREMTGAGIMDRNEARQKLNLNKRTGLSDPLVPQNMATVDEEGNVVPVSAPPSKPAASEEPEE
ncbi:MAG: phage portal protein [Gammaproteobacteria bacterium RIFCSPHIGHO2_12_FULL_63_22]|nr:MAG: phage portal protein [Gammaproteobacteria bacterium RIFCSPHIGHO2_12_FULL_63_22]